MIEEIQKIIESYISEASRIGRVNTKTNIAFAGKEAAIKIAELFAGKYSIINYDTDRKIYYSEGFYTVRPRNGVGLYSKTEDIAATFKALDGE